MSSVLSNEITFLIYNPQKVSSKKKKILEYIIDETLINLDQNISKERNMFMW
jgi:hypothetical protein